MRVDAIIEKGEKVGKGRGRREKRARLPPSHGLTALPAARRKRKGKNRFVRLLRRRPDEMKGRKKRKRRGGHSILRPDPASPLSRFPAAGKGGEEKKKARKTSRCWPILRREGGGKKGRREKRGNAYAR